MPEGSNLAHTPGIAVWIFGPSFLLFAALCIVTFTDFVSNSGANPYWLDTLWALSVAVVSGLIGLGLYGLAKLAKRFRE